MNNEFHKELMLLPEDQREGFINAHAWKVIVDQVFSRELSPEEKEQIKDEYMQTNISLTKMKEEFEKARALFKEKSKPVEKLTVQLLRQYKTGSVEEEGSLYLIDDQENGTMTTYDPSGNVISVRKLTADERQTTIFSLKQNAI